MSKKVSMAKVPRRVKNTGKACHWCQRVMDKDDATTALWPTRDHFEPQVRGGKETVVACRACNQMKGDMPAALWVTVMRHVPDVYLRFGNPGPQGMELFYDIFGAELEPHIDRIIADATERMAEEWVAPT